MRLTRFLRISYEQGQYYNQKIREYFYYINHEGQLFLHDSKMYNFTTCFKDSRFLTFFFRNLKMNDTKRYDKEFPYVSVCGDELNFVSCDDRPIVYTKWDKSNDTFQINWSNRQQKINPTSLFMLENGRLYHTSTFDGYGLVRSSLADELFPLFQFDEEVQPIYINWKGQLLKLDNTIIKNLK
uniref:DKNYY family protein n=1 Tax=Strongyloides stercoralis TaxID=6248 RepID=A0A0K0E0X4_STRER